MLRRGREALAHDSAPHVLDTCTRHTANHFPITHRAPAASRGAVSVAQGMARFAWAKHKATPGYPTDGLHELCSLRIRHGAQGEVQGGRGGVSGGGG
jgi:hypothetical protein